MQCASSTTNSDGLASRSRFSVSSSSNCSGDEQELEAALFQVFERLLAVGLWHRGVHLSRPTRFLLLDALDLVALQGDQGEITTVGPEISSPAIW